MSGGEGIPSIILADVERFFFDAPGYESGAERVSIPQFPGDKIIVARQGLFEIVDQYCVAPGGWSTGVMKIRYIGNVVWVMHYGGRYSEEVIPFLKLALRQVKWSREFIGGRGPRVFPNPGGTLLYVNTPEINGFSKFRGKEEIFDVQTGKSLGFHEYWGMSFLSQ